MVDQFSRTSQNSTESSNDSTSRCNALNQVILQAAIRLLKSRDWRQSLSEFLQALVDSAHASQVYLVRQVEQDGVPACEYPAGRAVASSDAPARPDPVDVRQFMAFLDSHSILRQGFNAATPKTCCGESTSLTSPITFPIEANLKWGWLVVEFSPDREPWHEVELVALRNAAAWIAASIGFIDDPGFILSAEARLRALLDQIPAIVYTGEFSNSPHLTWVSPQVEQYVGRKTEEFLADAELWLKIIHPHDRTRVRYSLRTAIKTKSPFSIEYRIVTKSGAPIWFRNEARIVYDENNRPHFIQGVLQDIHQRKVIGAELNRLYHEEHQHRLMMEGLTVSSSTLSATMDVEKIPDLLLQELNHILPYDTATFWFVEGEDLVLSRTRGYSLIYGKNIEQHLVQRARIEEMPSLKLILESGTPMIVEKLTSPSELEPHGFGKHIRSWAGAPILINGKPFGLFTIESREFERFTSNSRSILSAICGQASMSFQNAQSLKTEQELRARAELLQKATASLTAELELPQLLVQVMDYLGGVVAYDSVCLFLLEGDNKQARAVAGRGFEKPDEILDKLYQADDDLFAIVHQQRSPLILADTWIDPRFKRWGDARHIRGWMCVPLIWREKVIGFMTVDSRTVNAYNDEAAKYAQAFANQAASAIQMARLFTETQALAMTDPLTGVFNRRHFFELTTLMMAKARAEGQTLSAIMIDIDNYKHVNDTYGHLCGDQILKVVADCFFSVLKPGEVLGRLGGDEFTVVLPGMDRKQAEQVAEQLRSTLENASILANQQRVTVTASFGVAELDPERLDLDDMLNRADQALYQAKDAGRNIVV